MHRRSYNEANCQRLITGLGGISVKKKMDFDLDRSETVGRMSDYFEKRHILYLIYTSYNQASTRRDVSGRGRLQP